MAPDPAGIGATVQALRVAAGMSRAALGATAGVSASTLERLELDDRTPKLDLLRRIATALEVPVADLVAADTTGERVA